MIKNCIFQRPTTIGYIIKVFRTDDIFFPFKIYIIKDTIILFGDKYRNKDYAITKAKALHADIEFYKSLDFIKNISNRKDFE